jgi:hypothetical protein
MTTHTNKRRRRDNTNEIPTQNRSTSGNVLLTSNQFSDLIAMLNTTKEFMKKGMFTTCTTRYQGQRDRNTLERFIAAVSTFKTAEALVGLSILLENKAGTWWLEAKGATLTWN